MTKRSRMRWLLVMCVVALGLPNVARADDLTITFTIIGKGGLSLPSAGFNDGWFWWADTTVNAPRSAYVAHGLDTLQAEAQACCHFTDMGSGVQSEVFPVYFATQQTLGGSLLLSSPFSLQDGDTLNVRFSVITTEQEFQDRSAGFAFLLANGAIQAILGMTRPDGQNAFTDLTHPPSQDFPVQSPGVSISAPRMYSAADLASVTVGDVQYGILGVNHCSQTCGLDVSSSHIPGAGTYQLLFGVGGPTRPQEVSAIVLQYATVTPAPSTGVSRFR